MPRVVHFELPADDPARAIGFYRDVFGWEFHKWDGPDEYWLVSTGEGPGIDGGLARRGEYNPIPVNTLDVPSVDDWSAKVTAAGGQIVLPKMAIPGVGWLAYCKDPEGNTFGIMQADESAA